ncbi:MAG: transglycosylase family protein [Solirubrobacterales bacterium]
MISNLEFSSLSARICVLAIAALGTFAVTLATVETSGASSSGGIGTTPDEPEGEDSSAGGDSKYDRLWNKVSSKERKWARNTAKCESGGDPKAIGGGGMYRGAFQFLKATWAASPKSPGGDPIVYNYKTQAVVAVALKNESGAGHWPVCG